MRKRNQDKDRRLIEELKERFTHDWIGHINITAWAKMLGESLSAFKRRLITAEVAELIRRQTKVYPGGRSIALIETLPLLRNNPVHICIGLMEKASQNDLHINRRYTQGFLPLISNKSNSTIKDTTTTLHQESITFFADGPDTTNALPVMTSMDNASPSRIVHIDRSVDEMRSGLWMLFSRRIWICWRRSGRKKVPYNARSHRKASVSNRSTWNDHHQAYSTYRASQQKSQPYDGIGYMCDDGSFTGIDLDKCIVDGVINDWAWNIIQTLNSYTEVTPSGHGVRIIVDGTIPPLLIKGVHQATIEIYSQKRVFTFTGNHLAGTPMRIEQRSEQLAALYADVVKNEKTIPTAAFTGICLESEAQVLAKARSAKNAPKFMRLWAGDLSDYQDDHSRADLALCHMLVYWTNGDTAMMDRLFRQSGLYREKWNVVDYRERTIGRALPRKE